MGKHVAAYSRRGTRPGDAEDQERMLRRWAEGDIPLKVVWYRDGTVDEDGTWPSLARLLRAVHAGEVYSITCWRLDRVGRTAKELAEVFTLLGERGVRLVSLVEGIRWAPEDLKSLGRGLASVSLSEREARVARLAEGQAKARAKGLPVGRPHVVSPAQARAIQRLVDAGVTRTAIAKALNVSRGSIRAALLKAEAAEAVVPGPAA